MANLFIEFFSHSVFFQYVFFVLVWFASLCFGLVWIGSAGFVCLFVCWFVGLLVSGFVCVDMDAVSGTHASCGDKGIIAYNKEEARGALGEEGLNRIGG